MIKRSKIAISAALLLSAALALGGCSSGSSGSSDTNSSSSPQVGATGGDATSGASLGKLKVITMLSWPPLEETGADGKPKGMEIDMTNDLAKALGYSGVEWIVTNGFSGVIPGVASGKADMAAATVTGWAKEGTANFDTVKTRTEQVIFSRPYFMNNAVLISTNKDLTNVDDLKKGMSVFAQEGSSVDNWATQYLAPKGVKILAGPKSSTYTGLVAGSYDSAIAGQVNALQAQQQHPELVVGDSVPDLAAGFCFTFAPDNDALRQKVNDWLTKYIDDGSYAKLYKQYFPTLDVPDMPSNYFPATN
jgi:polar amino acid transport system substrate-binding protein